MTHVLKNTSDKRSIWILEHRPGATRRLVIAHHAGGSATAYLQFAKSFSVQIEVVMVELPGRGGGYSMPFLTEFADALQSITEALKALPKKPTAYFGHSMGGLIVFEVAKMMADSGAPPLHLFLSAVRHPSQYGTATKAARPDAWLLKRLKDHEGTPRAILESTEMLAIILPIFRADYLLIDSYTYPGTSSLSCPLTLLGGTEDPGVSRAELEAWQKESSGYFDLQQFEGGHFYTLKNYDEIKRIIQKNLGIPGL